MKGTSLVLYPNPTDVTEVTVEGKAYYEQQENLTSNDSLTIPYRFINDLHLYVLYLCNSAQNLKLDKEMSAFVKEQSNLYLEKFDAVFGAKLDPRLVKNRLESRTDYSYRGATSGSSTSFINLVRTIKKDYLPLMVKDLNLTVDEDIKTQAFYTDASIMRYLNESHLQACLRSDCVIEDVEFNFSTKANVSNYPIEEYISQLNHVSIILPEGTHTLRKEDRNSMEHSYPGYRELKGPPTHFYLKGYTMYLYPVPEQAYKLILECNKYPEVMSSNSDPIIPVAQRHHLIWYALSQLALRFKDFKTATFYSNKFENAFGAEVSNGVIMAQFEHMQQDGYLGPVDYMGNNNHGRYDDERYCW